MIIMSCCSILCIQIPEGSWYMGPKFKFWSEYEISAYNIHVYSDVWNPNS